MEFSFTFKIDLDSEEGRKQAEHLESWLAKERYDCPDPEVSGKFHDMGTELRQALYFTESHPCTYFGGCENHVEFDDEPFCFVHSPDSGSVVPGYSYKNVHAKG